jgi:DNA-directed RNA polymerase subunit omega
LKVPFGGEDLADPPFRFIAVKDPVPVLELLQHHARNPAAGGGASRLNRGPLACGKPTPEIPDGGVGQADASEVRAAASLVGALPCTLLEPYYPCSTRRFHGFVQPVGRHLETRPMIEALKSDEIVDKVGGRFKLCALIQRRLVQLMDGARPLVDREGRTDLEIVIEEILQDKITLDFDPSSLHRVPSEQGGFED